MAHPLDPIPHPPQLPAGQQHGGDHGRCAHRAEADAQTFSHRPARGETNHRRQATRHRLEARPDVRALHPGGRAVGAAAATRAALSLLLAATLLALPVHAHAAQGGWTPSTVFLQAGNAGHTRQLTAGFGWDWAWQGRLGPGLLTAYNEVSVSAWSYPEAGGRRTAWLGQLGVIPVWRYRPSDGNSPWFMEGGVGVTLTTTLYQTEQKSFSTNFNFGDHIAVGRSFGPARQHELALRVEHFSNAGIKRPNPGEDFLQLRYSHRFL